MCLEPLVVYPTPSKEQTYLREVAKIGKRTLAYAKCFYFVGYSLPPVDKHVPDMFPLESLRAGKVVVVNASRGEDRLRENYARAFPDVAIDYSCERFEEWVLAM
ncbi:MAG: hypothetical protein HY002_08060 [Candidatus Rokubacteria bacterium]|nr:hypothetical protein [Candidatus Rokubacteria bacterium]